MRLISVPCPVCDNEDFTVYLPDQLGENPPVFGYKWTPDIRKTYRMVKCTSCGHVYASPRLANIHSYYNDVADAGYLANQFLRMASAAAVLKTIRKYKTSGRLIDIGCSTGDFIFVAQENFEVEGLEPATWASKIARDRGLTVHRKLPKYIVGEEELYEVATLWGVIEHFEEPFIEMQRVCQLLKSGGLVCIWTGDVDTLWAKIFGANWWYVMGQHLHLFSRKSLNQLMRRAGFEVVEESIYPYVISFESLGYSLSRYPLVGPLARAVFGIRLFKGKTFQLKISDEIFSVYRKIR